MLGTLGRRTLRIEVLILAATLAIAILGVRATTPAPSPAAATVSFAGPITDAGVDPDGDSRFEQLVIHVPLRISALDDYLVDVFLADTSVGLAHAGLPSSRIVHLLPGDTDVALSYSGIAVARLAQDGPWNLSVGVTRLGRVAAGDHIGSSHETAAYSRTAFESRPVARLRGNVSGFIDCSYSGPLCGYATLLDPANGFLLPGLVTHSWSGGVIDLPAYNATFELLLEASGYPEVPTVVMVAVAGDTTEDFALPALSADAANRTLIFTGSNVTVETVDYVTLQFASWIRFTADAYGNRDGVANLSELGAYVPYGPALSTGPFFPLEVLQAFAADNQTLVPSAFAASALRGAGPVVAAAPVSARLVRTWSTSGPPPGTANHSYFAYLALSVNLSRGTDELAFPSGSAGNLTLSSGATVLRLGPASWRLVPTVTGLPGTMVNAELRITVTFPDTSSEPPTVHPTDSFLVGTAIAAAAIASSALIASIMLRRRVRPPAPPSAR